jgi:L-iditol 2-dehydrogenase
LVRVRAVCICPSDWRMYADGHAGGVVPDRPIIQGHEFAGDVVELGADAEGVQIGSRVAVEPSWPCGGCDICLAGRGNICRRVRFPSFPPVDGALAELIACPVSALAVLPDSLSYVDGALAEPLGVSMHAVRLAQARPGEHACVLGAGVIGIGCLLMLRRAGIEAIAGVEPLAERRPYAARLGAEPVTACSAELEAADYEADMVLECSGDEAGLDQAVRLARPGGRVIVVGIPRQERVEFDMSIARRRELTVICSRRSHDTIAEAVNLMATRQLDLSDIPTRSFGLGETEEALRLTGEPGAVLRYFVRP